MQIKKKRDTDLIGIAKKEIVRNKREHKVIVFLWYITIFSLLIVGLFLCSKLIITGYSVYIHSRPGYITEVDLTSLFPTTYWHGVYGLALRVPGFSERIFNDARNGEIARKDIFFDCLKSDSIGGSEIYASTSQFINFDELRPATLEEIDRFVGCSGRTECPSNTYTMYTSFVVGTRNITLVPATYTYKYDGQNNVYDIGVMNDSVNLVFAAHLTTLQKGYSPSVTVNYQMLLPVPANTTLRYYFFNDPYDECPGGGLGDTIFANVWGYAKDSEGNLHSNVSVVVAGYETITGTDGFFNLSFSVITGKYNLVANKPGFDPYIESLEVNFSSFSFHRNVTLVRVTPGNNMTIFPIIFGYVTDVNLIPIENTRVYLGDAYDFSDTTGYYSLKPTITAGAHTIVAFKLGYHNYFEVINFSWNDSLINHNITLESIDQALAGYNYPTGPYSSGPYTAPPGVQQRIIQETRKTGEDYWISTKEIRREVRQNTFIEDVIGLYNFRKTSMNLLFSVSEDIQDIVKIEKPSMILPSSAYGSLAVTIFGTRPIGTYNGTIYVSGDIEREIPVIIRIIDKRFVVDTLLMDLNLFNKIVLPGDNLKYRLTLQNLLRDQNYKVEIEVSVTDSNSSITYAEDKFEIEISESLSLLRDIKIPKNLTEGEYLLNAKAYYLNYFSSVTTQFKVAYPIYLYSFLGLPLWMWFAIISFISFLCLNIFIYKGYKDKKKRYRIQVDMNTLPRKGDKVVRLGKLAETKNPAYYELERLTTHAIIAGATGMGKSISAQVIIEEALMNNIAVIVFDPTAQWSGMLRKCEDKRMLSFYPGFGMKESDARGFKGNARQIKDPRQLIDITKFMTPGQIQIFSLNKLEPKDIDIFVANVIRQIFRSDPKESPNLKVLIVFDEVHRLLSKFGGSGEGFLQVERACREFRKWGLGVMLISQVLSDFVGEIKANINTEIQARTLEENDLERIKTKYGEGFLKSLVRAEVGVAMFQNAEYNRGRPYFINFRPILHNTRRLPDEELEKYNKYNEIVDELEYQIEQLEQEKVDTFDLKMELKLVKDKIMTGSFIVVEIYMEGLRPRVEKEWEKIGKKPKKRQVELVSEDEIRKSVEEAKKERKKIEKEEEKKLQKEAGKKIEENIDLMTKEVRPFTFDNGIMVSSVKELAGVLQNIDSEIFRTHVNEEKNEISEWFEKNISEEFGKKIAKTSDKKELYRQINEFFTKKKKTDQTREKGDENKEKGVDEEAGAKP